MAKSNRIDDFLFDDDPILTAEHRSRRPQRGGSGIVNVIKANGYGRVTRNIILGKNIPGY